MQPQVIVHFCALVYLMRRKKSAVKATKAEKGAKSVLRNNVSFEAFFVYWAAGCYWAIGLSKLLKRI